MCAVVTSQYTVSIKGAAKTAGNRNKEQYLQNHPRRREDEWFTGRLMTIGTTTRTNEH